jgi:hypothetical protein
VGVACWVGVKRNRKGLKGSACGSVLRGAADKRQGPRCAPRAPHGPRTLALGRRTAARVGAACGRPGPRRCGVAERTARPWRPAWQCAHCARRETPCVVGQCEWLKRQVSYPARGGVVVQRCMCRAWICCMHVCIRGVHSCCGLTPMAGRGSVAKLAGVGLCVAAVILPSSARVWRPPAAAFQAMPCMQGMFCAQVGVCVCVR